MDKTKSYSLGYTLMECAGQYYCGYKTFLRNAPKNRFSDFSAKHKKKFRAVLRLNSVKTGTGG